MLLGYGAKNCWCFKDWMEIDCELNSKVPSDISLNLPAATAMCFKGANASGKTNAMKVLAFIVDFAKNSFNYAPNSKIAFDSFFYNGEPSEFYIEFLVGAVKYKYELSATKNEIIKEILYRKKDRESIVFSRTGNAITKNTLYTGHKDIIFRNNASFISTLHQHGLPEIKEVYDFFDLMILNVVYTGLSESFFSVDLSKLSMKYLENEEILRFSEKTIKKFDMGIEKIEIRTKTNEKNELVYYPVFMHKTPDGELKPMLYEFESSGTKNLFCNLALYMAVLSLGGILVLDEFDINLHPDILPHLLDFFIKKDLNLKNAQLLLITHNSDIMDILGRYRTYLFQKEDGESFCYRLDEVNSSVLRNDRPVSVPYKKGLLGGVPKIGDD